MLSVPFEIVPKEISDGDIMLNDGNEFWTWADQVDGAYQISTYSGQINGPEVRAMRDPETELEFGANGDYVITGTQYASKAGEYTLTVTGVKNTKERLNKQERAGNCRLKLFQ